MTKDPPASPLGLAACEVAEAFARLKAAEDALTAYGTFLARPGAVAPGVADADRAQTLLADRDAAAQVLAAAEMTLARLHRPQEVPAHPAAEEAPA
jgi:hypothetical protein